MSPAAGGTPERGPGDHEADMSATGFLSDDVIEAIVHDRPVDPSWATLAAFTRQVRALGDGPAPRPSSELAALLGRTTAADAGTDVDLVSTARLPVVAMVDRPGPATEPTDVAGAHRSNGSSAPTGPTQPTGSLERPGTVGAGRRRIAKVVLGVAVATAGVAGAGAVGILPAAANDAVRSAIEAVTPVHFADRSDAPTNAGDHGSDAPTSDDHGSGGTTTIDDGATGADHRPDPSAAGEPPGQSGDTGLTRANETPAEPHAPDTTPTATAPSTVPASGPPDTTGHGAPESVPSTVPVRGGPTDDHSPDA